MKYAVFLFICIGFSTSFAYEVDQFTNRDQKPKDSTDLIDQEIKKRLTTAIENANSGWLTYSCNGDKNDKKESRMKLFRSIREELTTGSPVGLLEKFATKKKKISKRNVSFEESIYKDASKFSKILKVYEATSVISVNGVEIGADKLGHFFDQGYGIYLSNYKAQTEAQKYYNGLSGGKSMENNEFGLLTTGIYSYGDMAANYEGHKFWEKLCGSTNEDTSQVDRDHISLYRCHKDAYIQCDIQTGKWILNPKQNFTLRDYVNTAWDESINCSMYSSEAAPIVTKELTRKVHFYKGNPKQPCPAEPKKCLTLPQIYNSPASMFITSPICKKIIEADLSGETISPDEKFNYDLEEYRNGAKPSTDKATKTKKVNTNK